MYSFIYKTVLSDPKIRLAERNVIASDNRTPTVSLFL